VNQANLFEQDNELTTQASHQPALLSRPLVGQGQAGLCDAPDPGRGQAKAFPSAKYSWVLDLYRTFGVPEPESQSLEVEFMGPLDGNASLAMTKLVARRDLDQDERRAWAKFLLSLLYRNKEAVADIKSHMAALTRETLIASQAEWDRLRKPGEIAPLVEAMADRELAMAERASERILNQIIGEHDRAEADIAARHWTCVDLSRSETSLLTSDRPMVFGDLANPDAYIALPLGPYDLFIAATDDRFERQLPLKNPSKVAWTMNKDVVSQARGFVWGTDDALIDFVRTYIRSQPDRVILSNAQKQAELAAVRAGRY
jgi:Protein of unknown function (DUF4238)